MASGEGNASYLLGQFWAESPTEQGTAVTRCEVIQKGVFPMLPDKGFEIQSSYVPLGLVGDVYNLTQQERNQGGVPGETRRAITREGVRGATFQ